MPTVLLSVNECTIFRMLILILSGREVWVLDIQPLVPLSRGFLSRLVDWFEKCGRLQRASKGLSGFDRYTPDTWEIEIAELYPRLRHQLIEMYNCDALAALLGPYGRQYSSATFIRLKGYLKKVLILHNVQGTLADAEIKMIGLPIDLPDLYQLSHGHSLDGIQPISQIANTLFASIGSGLIFFATAAFLIRACFFRCCRIEKFKIGFDIAFEGANREMCRRVSTNPADIFYLCRNRDVMKVLDEKEVLRYRHGMPTDGWCRAEDFSSLVSVAFKDILQIRRVLRGVPADLQCEVMKQVYNRLVYRALFNRYKFNAYLARDEYNTDAITRTQELRRAGIRSCGVAHGMNIIPSIYPQFEYLEFDDFFVIGVAQAAAYAATWPREMNIIPVQSPRFPSAMASLDQTKRSKDIVLFGSQHVDTKRFIEFCKDIAMHFKDRRIILKIKYRREYPSSQVYDKYLEKFSSISERIELVEGEPYEIMKSAGYAFGCLTTAIVEFAQAGGVGFFVDVFDEDLDVFFRQFPEFCVNSPQEAIMMIQGLEAGVREYPRERFEDLFTRTSDTISTHLRSLAGISTDIVSNN